VFEYFEDNYPWSLSVVWAIEASGTFSEIHDAIQILRPVAKEDAARSGLAWYSAWHALAAQRLRAAREAELTGFAQSAGRSYYRAGIYQLMAIRFLPRTDPRGNAAYVEGTKYFLRGLELLRKPGRALDVPYEGGMLPGILAVPPSSSPVPCVVIFGGFDSLKEWLYPIVIDAFMARGVALFVVDQAGVGGALRLHNVPAVPEAERSAKACLDVLERIPEIDPRRIGLAGISLGGYYAPRAAAFEPRIRACCAWGGAFSPAKLFNRLATEPDKARSIPDMIEHARWVFGATDRDQTLRILQRLSLAPVIERVRCPLLVLHGANDRQVNDDDAENTTRLAINSPKTQLKVFGREEGGAEHCQLDNAALAGDYMADWFAETLGRDPGQV
jgi:dienelactone hydrolase